MSTDDRSYKRWFASLLGELAQVPGDGRFFGAHAKHATRRAPVVIDWDPPGAGWYAEVARVGSSYLQVWYDRYLDRSGDPHLGVWLHTGVRTARAVVHELGVVPEYTWKDRDTDGFLKSVAAREERRRIGRYVFDDWRPNATIWVGSYVRESPHARDPADSVGAVVSAMRRLADALSPPAATQSPVPSADRYWELVRRLARPNQARFRADLILRHGAVCMISGCAEDVVIDAAHIDAVRVDGADHVDNGLLLRADLHRLFDGGLLTISGDDTPRVQVATQLGDAYQQLGGSRVRGLGAAQLARLRARNEAWTPGGLVLVGARSQPPS